MTIGDFLRKLDERRIAYKLDRVRDALMVIVNIPGERWEVEFFEDGDVDAECFKSTNVIEGTDEVLESIISRGS